MKISDPILYFNTVVENRSKKINISELDLSEANCKQCGICCCTKYWIQDELDIGNLRIEILNNQACEYLQTNKLCSIYAERLSRNNCASIERAILGGLLPASCGYVEKNWEAIKDWYIIPKIK